MSVSQASCSGSVAISDPHKVTADCRLAPTILSALQADGPTQIVEHGVLPINFACPNLLMQQSGVRVGIDSASPWSGAMAQA